MATEYFKKPVNDEVYIVEFDTETLQSRMFRRKDLVAERNNAEDRLAKIGKQPTNAELLAWAREHYPYMDYGPEIASLEAVIARNTAIIEAVK